MDYLNWDSGNPGVTDGHGYFHPTGGAWLSSSTPSTSRYCVCKAQHMYYETTTIPTTTTTVNPPADCEILEGTWRSTNPGSAAHILLLSQDDSGEFVKLEGLFRNSTQQPYYGMDGWIGHERPSAIMLNSIFQAGKAVLSLNGKVEFLFFVRP